MKQKHYTINSVPKSYFTSLQKLSKRSIGKRINRLLNELLVGNEQNGYKIRDDFELKEFEPMLSTYKHSPVLYKKALTALKLAQDKFSTDEKKVAEVDIINQIIYQDFHSTKRGK
jgi:uncharacterized protein YpbB